MHNVIIKPGEAVGPIKLGMYEDEVNQVLEGHELDLFQTKVEELIPRLNEISPYALNDYYSEGCQYDFPELGLRLWRSIELNMKDLVNLSEDEQEEYMDKLYFETFVIYPPIK